MICTINGHDDNGATVYETFQIPGDVPVTPETVRAFAIQALWEARWTPGSCSWRVSLEGQETTIGENY